MAQNWRFLARWASFFAETQLEGVCRASFFAPIGPAPVLDIARRSSGWLRWGFCGIGSWLAVYLRRVAALMMQFPPFGGGEAVVQGGVAPKSQTASVKNTGEGCGGRGGLRFGGIDRCRGVLFARHPPEHASQSLVAHSSACRGINRLTSCESCYMAVLSSNEAKSGRG